jgi:hypothetical protein
MREGHTRAYAIVPFYNPDPDQHAKNEPLFSADLHACTRLCVEMMPASGVDTIEGDRSVPFHQSHISETLQSKIQKPRVSSFRPRLHKH